MTAVDATTTASPRRRPRWPRGAGCSAFRLVMSRRLRHVSHRRPWASSTARSAPRRPSFSPSGGGSRNAPSHTSPRTTARTTRRLRVRAAVTTTLAHRGRTRLARTSRTAARRPGSLRDATPPGRTADAAADLVEQSRLEAGVGFWQRRGFRQARPGGFNRGSTVCDR